MTQTKPKWMSPVRRTVEAFALLMKAPRSRLDLKEAMEVNSNGQAEKYINAMREEGLLYIESWIRGEGRGCQWRPVFAVQPSVCELPDAPKPSPQKRRSRRKEPA